MQSAQSCLTEIESLSSGTSSEIRGEMLRRVTDLFFLTIEQHTADDAIIFGNVMERVAYELETEARVELSERISAIDKAPHRLVCRLASDEIAVAKSVLERSQALTDIDLVQIAKTKDQSHLHAIATRPNLSAPVTDAIVERGEARVLLEVVNNKGAEFTNAGINVLARKDRSDGKLLHALGKRADLPADLMQEIEARVAAKIKTGMAESQIEADLSDLDALIDEGAANLNVSKPTSTQLRACLNEITDLCASAGTDKTAKVLDKVVDLHFMTAKQQSAAERAAFGGLMARMANVANPIIRVRLAERFACTGSAPIALLRQLAGDEISVARPILQYSPCLREADIMSIVSEAGQDHLLATACRYDLTIPVTDILVRRGKQRVHQAIVHNVSAELSAESIEQLKQIGEGDETVQSILRIRQDITSNPINRLWRLNASEFWRNVT